MWGSSQSTFTNDPLQKQVESLYSFFPGQVKTVKPSRQYEVTLLVGPSRAAVTIIIWLPNDFPQGKPILTVSPTLAHRWVDKEMRVIGHDSLAVWNQAFSIGKIIKDIEIEFNLRPPSIVTIASASGAESSAMEVEFPEVDSENLQHLNVIATDPDEFEKLFKQTSAANEAFSVEKELASGNLQLAKRNISKTNEISSLKAQLLELQGELKSVKTASENTRVLKKDILSRFSLGSAVSYIRNSADKELESSDRLLQNFSSRQIDGAEFLSKFKAHKKKYHLQLIKSEKLEQLYQ